MHLSPLITARSPSLMRSSPVKLSMLPTPLAMQRSRVVNLAELHYIAGILGNPKPLNPKPPNPKIRLMDINPALPA